MKLLHLVDQFYADPLGFVRTCFEWGDYLHNPHLNGGAPGFRYKGFVPIELGEA